MKFQVNAGATLEIKKKYFLQNLCSVVTKFMFIHIQVAELAGDGGFSVFFCLLFGHAFYFVYFEPQIIILKCIINTKKSCV